MAEASKPGLGTLSVWAGEEQQTLHQPSAVPVAHSVSFDYEDVEQSLEVAVARKRGYTCSRNTNSTVHTFEERVRILEGGDGETGC